MPDKKIGILVLSIGNFGNKGFYNLQEVGLAKALSPLFKEVLIYRLIGIDQNETVEQISENVSLYLVPSKKIGSNGIPNIDKIDKSISSLVCFSDTQIFFPSVARWCKKNSIQLIPYIGVSKSHSDNPIKQLMIDGLFNRNLAIYRRITCLAKTPNLAEELKGMGVNDVRVAPVGLDVDLLKSDYADYDVNALKKKYGYKPEDKIALFIGRMTAEKQPLRMIEIFKKVYGRDNTYRLLMVGSGELSQEVSSKILKEKVEQFVQRIEKVPNKDIWELYRIADCFVNLNQQEIYGMVLLEAMYYGCKVVAWDAPGPNYIIEQNISGYIVKNDEEAVGRILHGKLDIDNMQQYVLRRFTWDYTAKLIAEVQ